MDSGRPIRLRGEGDEYELGTILGRLKERGCSILVAGDMPVTAFRTVSRRLFGHPEERRERVLVRFRPTTSLEEWFPAGVDLESRGVRVVDCTAPDRSAAGGDADFERLRWQSTFDPAETPALSRCSDVEGCTDEIDAVAAGTGALEPSQIRVGVHSLGAFDGHDEMIDAVSALSSTVTARRGMVHYHLQRPPTSETARTLLEHVDAMITIRKDVPGELPVQRWTIPGYGESPWVPLRRYD